MFEEAYGNLPPEDFLERLNEKKDLLVLLAYSGDVLIGFKIGYVRYKGVFFSWLGGVVSGNRRKGVARALLRRQHEICLERGYEEIQTEASGSNQPMLILNLQEDFEIYGSRLGRMGELKVDLRKRISE
ncbi:MAG: GNAT family N-acetyltransferase [Opitutales bacterium]